MWLRTVACGILLLLLQVQGETPAGDDRDQGQICHTVQKHSLRLGAEGFKTEGTGPIASMAIHNLQIMGAGFEEKETNFIICGTKTKISRLKVLILCRPILRENVYLFKESSGGELEWVTSCVSTLVTGLDSPGVCHHFSEAVPWLEGLLLGGQEEIKGKRPPD
jgi:hypothetical protein